MTLSKEAFGLGGDGAALNFNEDQVRVLFEYFRQATPAMLAVAADLRRRR